MANPQQNPTYITPGSAPKSTAPPAQHVKPTLLAFHGSGSNATVHTVQLARLMRVLRPHVEVEVLEAPFPSSAGPGVLPFFDGCGPFARWVPPTEKVSLDSMRTGSSTHVLAPEVEALVRSAATRISATGSRVVGLIGFSQGTRVVAGLLRASELCKEKGLEGEETAWLRDLRFGISVCGSYPPPLVPRCVLGKDGGNEEEAIGKRIGMPAFHVQGKNDEWVWAGRGLIDGHYEVGEGRSEVVEWEMGHHYPVAPEENERIGEWVLGVLKKAEAEGRAVR